MMDLASIGIIAGFVLGSNGIVTIVVWGMKSQLRADLAEQEIRIIKGINGTYVRTPTCNARHGKDRHED